MKTLPHRTAERIVRILTPPGRRHDLAGDLYEGFGSTRECVRYAVTTLPFAVADDVAVTFNLVHAAGEAAVILIALAGATLSLPVFPTVFVLAAAMTGLSLRNAYLHPVQGVPKEVFGDGVIAGVFMLFSEAFLLIVNPSLELHVDVLMRGVALAVLLVSCMRALIRKAHRPQPQEHPYQWTWPMSLILGTGFFINNYTQPADLKLPLKALLIPVFTLHAISLIETRWSLGDSPKRLTAEQMLFVLLIAMSAATAGLLRLATMEEGLELLQRRYDIVMMVVIALIVFLTQTGFGRKR